MNYGASNAAVEAEPYQDETIAELTAIWRHILQQTSIGENDDFFDLGGDSLSAIALFAEIEKRLGRALPLTAIYDAPTIRLQAALLDGAAGMRATPIVQLKTGDSAGALYIVHGIGGSAMELRGPAVKMSGPNAVYAFEACGFDGQPPLDDIGAMASLYVDALRRHQPEGPYRIAGYSFGGLIALEMARELKNAGAEVDRLILIDSYPDVSTWPQLARLDSKYRKILLRSRLLMQGGFGEAWTYLSDFIRRGGRGGRVSFVSDDPDLPPNFRLVQEGGERALITYVPSYYPGRVDFIAAKRPMPDFPRYPGMLWRHLVAEFEIHSVDADHRSIVVADAHRLADRLSTLLESGVK